MHINNSGQSQPLRAQIFPPAPAAVPGGTESVEEPSNAVPMGRLVPGGGGGIGGSGQAERGDAMYLYGSSPANRPDAPVLPRHVPIRGTPGNALMLSAGPQPFGTSNPYGHMGL